MELFVSFLVKKYILLSLIGLSFAPLYASSVHDWHIATLQEEENKIKAKFLKISGASEAEWQQALKQAAEQYDQKEVGYRAQLGAHPQPSDAIKNCAQSLLMEQGGDPAKLQIMSNSPGAGPVTYKSIIAISQDFLAKFNATQDETEGVLMHEIIHYIKQDEVCWLACKIMYDAKSWFIQIRLNPILHVWQLFREKRADILAGLSKPSRAQALANFYKKLLNSESYYPKDAHHPPMRKRIDYMLALYESMQSDRVTEPSVITKAISTFRHVMDRLAVEYSEAIA